MGKGALWFPCTFQSTRGNKGGSVPSCRLCLKRLLDERREREADFDFSAWENDPAAFAFGHRSIFYACDSLYRKEQSSQHVVDRLPGSRGVVHMFNP